MIYTEKFDAVIVGGGPAGATAGFLLNRLGHRVCIIDKSKFPREKLCGGLLTEKTLWLNERVFGVSEEELRDRAIINYTASGYIIKNRYSTLVNGPEDIRFYFTDRIKYDAFFLAKARESGVAVIEGERVTGYDPEGKTVSTSGGRLFTGRYIIGADGVNSLIRGSFPENKFNIQKWRKNLVTSIEIFIKRDDIPPENEIRYTDRPILFLSLIKYGYAWIFPRDDRIVFGIGGLYKKNRGRMLKTFIEFLEKHGINDHERYKKHAHCLPCGYYMTEPVSGNTILTGDAGGFVDPLLGEGIFYAQRTGELAAWSIHKNITEARPLDRVYKKFIWKYILPEFFNARVTRSAAYYISENLAHIPVKIVFWMMGGILHQVLHGSRTNRGFFRRRIHRAVTLNRTAQFLTRPERKRIYD